MSDQQLFSFCITVCLVGGVLASNNSQLLLEFGSKQLSRFENFGDQEVFHWVNPHTPKYMLQFKGSIVQTGGGISVHCADSKVHLLVRRGALPIPNPLQTYVPANTFIQSIGLVANNTFIISQSKELTYEIEINSQQNAGHYFASVFLPDQENKIGVSGLTQQCKYYGIISLYTFPCDNSSYNPNQSTTIQSNVTKLIRKENSLFNVKFVDLSNSTSNLSSDNNRIFEWEILPGKDSGGILKISIQSKSSQHLVEACVYSQTFSDDNCTSGELLQLNGTSGYTWHFPYPVSGRWYLATLLTCVNTSTCLSEVTVSVELASCIDNCHSRDGQGSCGFYRSDDILFVSCRCRVGWRGIACTDGREALSYAEQLLRTLLLTLSNLMFLVCVVLAIYRKFFTEALVYFFVAFMSSFYHACDQPGAAVYCIMNYETLQFSDFLSSVTAIWFTLVAIAKPPHRLESFLHVVGCLSFAVGVSYDRFSAWVVLVPGIIGVIMVITAWGLKCRSRRVCYPGKRKTLLAYIPGIISAGTGLVLYAFVETEDNYYIVHSLWHILMATAVIFLLPLGPKCKANQSCATNKADRQDQPLALEQSSNDFTYHSYNNADLEA